MYITHLTRRFYSSRSIRNYVLGIRTLRRELELTSVTLESFQVNSLLGVADIFMRTPPLRDVYLSCLHFCIACVS